MLGESQLELSEALAIIGGIVTVIPVAWFLGGKLLAVINYVPQVREKVARNEGRLNRHGERLDEHAERIAALEGARRGRGRMG